MRLAVVGKKGRPKLNTLNTPHSILFRKWPVMSCTALPVASSFECEQPKVDAKKMEKAYGRERAPKNSGQPAWWLRVAADGDDVRKTFVTGMNTVGPAVMLKHLIHLELE